MDKRPLFVRLPPDAAEKLDRASFELRKSKQDLVAGLVQSHLPFPAGHYSFTAAEPPADVLTLEEAAALLRSDETTVADMAERGEIPGRKLGDEWRFARSAILRWLTRSEEES
jgi:excisionase family DNA binding protein